MSGKNRFCSDGDRISVDSTKECQKAAYAMKYEYREYHERYLKPRGCYFFHDTEKIYFNIHPAGIRNMDAEQICKGKGTHFFAWSE